MRRGVMCINNSKCRRRIYGGVRVRTAVYAECATVATATADTRGSGEWRGGWGRVGEGRGFPLFIRYGERWHKPGRVCGGGGRVEG